MSKPAGSAAKPGAASTTTAANIPSPRADKYKFHAETPFSFLPAEQSDVGEVVRSTGGGGDHNRVRCPPPLAPDHSPGLRGPPPPRLAFARAGEESQGRANIVERIAVFAEVVTA